jgi:hypothetical protein
MTVLSKMAMISTTVAMSTTCESDEQQRNIGKFIISLQQKHSYL